MRTWFQRWLSAATAAATSAPPESMLRPEWLVVEVLVKDVMVALEADRSSSAPPEDVVVRPPCCWWWCEAAGGIGGHLAAGGWGGHEP